MDMIERVAQAIYASSPFPDGLEFLDPEPWRSCIDSARAAIAAMRNCTPAMLDAGSAAHPAGGYVRETLLNDIIEAEWVAMCDAALECSTKPDEK